jgi:hypothetical protein
MSSPRVSVRMRNALTAELQRQIADGVMDVDLLVQSVITAEDATTRYLILTQDPHERVVVYGIYATPDAANKAMDLGVCATMPGTRAIVVPLNPAPKMPRKAKA